MSSAVLKLHAVRIPPLPWSQSSRARKRRAVFAGVVMALGLGLGGWLLVDRASGRSESNYAAPIAGSQWIGGAGAWLEGLQLTRVERQLVGAGYSINVDGRLDAVTKSALADYVRVSAAHPLSQSLARALQATVITGRRDPAAWNNRFGLDRPTKYVERPLTGRGGQLDANGNIRATTDA